MARRARTQSPSKQVAAPAHEPIGDLVPDAHDFTGTMEEWEERVFRNATLFRLHRLHGEGHTERAEMASFKVAMIEAHAALANGKRVLVYAVTAAGRFVALPQKRWEHYARIWLTTKGNV